MEEVGGRWSRSSGREISAGGWVESGHWRRFCDRSQTRASRSGSDTGQMLVLQVGGEMVDQGGRAMGEALRPRREATAGEAIGLGGGSRCSVELPLQERPCWKETVTMYWSARCRLTRGEREL